MTHQGSSIVTWCGYGDQPGQSDSSGYGVFIQRFNNLGDPENIQGVVAALDETRINNVTDGNQWLSSVSCNGNGNYAVSWTGVDAGNSAQTMVFSAAGMNTSPQADTDGPLVGGVALVNNTPVLPSQVMQPSAPGLPELKVLFDENLNDENDSQSKWANSVVNPVNWLLSWNGQNVPNAITSITFSNPDPLTRKYEATITINPAAVESGAASLPAGAYVLTVCATITDGQNELDANFTGNPGALAGYAGYEFPFTLAAGSSVQIPVPTTGNGRRSTDLPPDAAGGGSQRRRRIHRHLDGHGDDLDGRILDRVYYQLYQANGTPADMPMYASSEVQEISFPQQPTGGSWTVSYGGQTTGSLGWNVTAAELASALNGLSSINDSVQVVAGANAWTYFVVFQGAWPIRTHLLSVNASGITPSVTPSVSQVVKGVAGMQPVLVNNAQTGTPVILPEAAPVLTVTPDANASFDNTLFDSDNQRYASVTCDPSGDFAIAWTDYHTANGSTQANIYAEKFDAMGGLLGINETTSAAVYDPNGSSGATQVNAYTGGNQVWPTVAMDLQGDFVVTWSSYKEDGGGYGVYARQFDPTGAPTGSPFLVNVTTQGNQELSTVAMDHAGDFVIASNSNPTSTKSNIVARAYNASGNPITGELAINQANTGNQDYADVGTDLAGDNFVVAWQSSGEDGSGYGIYARKYTGLASGNVAPATGEFLVNTTTQGDQMYPSVSESHLGTFVISWNGNGQQPQENDPSGVFIQRYSAASTAAGATAVGLETRVNTTTGVTNEFASVGMDAHGDYVLAWTASTTGATTSNVYTFPSANVVAVAPLDGPIVCQVALPNMITSRIQSHAAGGQRHAAGQRIEPKRRHPTAARRRAGLRDSPSTRRCQPAGRHRPAQHPQPGELDARAQRLGRSRRRLLCDLRVEPAVAHL